MSKVHDRASDVCAAQGEVVVDGPDGIAYSMSPEAAAETSERLLAGAAQAQGQRLADEDRARTKPGRA